MQYTPSACGQQRGAAEEPSLRSLPGIEPLRAGRALRVLRDPSICWISGSRR
jgi:hypothetical protein